MNRLKIYKPLDSDTLNNAADELNKNGWEIVSVFPYRIDDGFVVAYREKNIEARNIPPPEVIQKYQAMPQENPNYNSVGETGEPISLVDNIKQHKFYVFGVLGLIALWYFYGR